MHHPVLGIIMYALLGSAAVAVAYGITTPIVDKMPSNKMTALAAIWIALLLLMPILSAWGESFLEDKNVAYLTELGHEWPLFITAFVGMLISLFRRWRKQSL